MYAHLGISTGDGYFGLDDIHDFIAVILLFYILFILIPFYKSLKPWSPSKVIIYIYLPIIFLFYVIFIF